MAIQKNEGYSGDFVQMGMTSLGREWKGIKRELDKARRAAKKEAERRQEAEKRAQGIGSSSSFGGGYPSQRHGGRDFERDDAYRGGPPPRNSYAQGERRYGGSRYDDEARPAGYRGHHR